MRETLDTMHFKGISKENFVKHIHHHFNDTNSKQFVDLSHISPMEPQCTTYHQSEKSAYVLVLPKELTKMRGEILFSKTMQMITFTTNINLVSHLNPHLASNFRNPNLRKSLIYAI